MKKIILITLTLMMFTTINLGDCAAQPKKEILVYSAKFGGINYVAGLTVAELLNKTHPWIRATNMESTGSVENIKRDADNPKMKAKTLRAGVGQVYWSGRQGIAPLFDKKYEDMRLMFSAAVSMCGLFATTNPKIQSPKDLIGKRVGVGEKGSAFLVETQFILKDCWGIWDKIKPEYLGFKPARDAFMDGLVDAVYSPGNLPGKGKYGIHPLMKSALQLKKGLHFVSLTKEELDKGAKKRGWSISPMTLPAGGLKANVPAKDTMVYNTQLMFWAYSDMPENIAYEIIKTVHTNIKKFNEAHAAMRIMSPEVMAWLPAATEDEIHPGALKYYKEKGIKISIGGNRPEL